MIFAGGVCLEFGFRRKSPRKSAVILNIRVKGLNRGPKLIYFESVAYF